MIFERLRRFSRFSISTQIVQRGVQAAERRWEPAIETLSTAVKNKDSQCVGATERNMKAERREGVRHNDRQSACLNVSAVTVLRCRLKVLQIGRTAD